MPRSALLRTPEEGVYRVTGRRVRVLLQLSHHSAGQPDGWSGAPDEAVWVQSLVALVKPGLEAKGVTVTLVDGDLGSKTNPGATHPAYAQDYDAFIAPHYEANLHGMGGSFWGRAAASTTGAQDDRLGAIFWRRYQALPGVPTPHFEWNNPNVTAYYAFNLTSAHTPGILVEHGVGAPGAPDHDWMRTNLKAIAQTWVDAICEFGGISGSSTPPQEGTDMTPAQEAKLDRLLALAEAREALVWQARTQRALDVETGKPFDATKPPVDPRIKQ